MKTEKRFDAAESILTGAREAIAWARGEKVKARVSTIQIPEVDVKTVRKKLKLSQAAFAARFGLLPASVRNWEQGRRQPEHTARLLLAVIAKHPEAVQDVLK
jgi:putative transcriptional regulator